MQFVVAYLGLIVFSLETLLEIFNEIAQENQSIVVPVSYDINDGNGSGNWGIGRTSEIARAVTNYLVSDMDMNRHFDTSLYFDSLKYEAFYPNRYDDDSYWVNETVSPAFQMRWI